MPARPAELDIERLRAPRRYRVVGVFRVVATLAAVAALGLGVAVVLRPARLLGAKVEVDEVTLYVVDSGHTVRTTVPADTEFVEVHAFVEPASKASDLRRGSLAEAVLFASITDDDGTEHRWRVHVASRYGRPEERARRVDNDHELPFQRILRLAVPSTLQQRSRVVELSTPTRDARILFRGYAYARKGIAQVAFEQTVESRARGALGAVPGNLGYFDLPAEAVKYALGSSKYRLDAHGVRGRDFFSTSVRIPHLERGAADSESAYVESEPRYVLGANHTAVWVVEGRAFEIIGPPLAQLRFADGWSNTMSASQWRDVTLDATGVAAVTRASAAASNVALFSTRRVEVALSHSAAASVAERFLQAPDRVWLHTDSDGSAFSRALPDERRFMSTRLSPTEPTAFDFGELAHGYIEALCLDAANDERALEYRELRLGRAGDWIRRPLRCAPYAVVQLDSSLASEPVPRGKILSEPKSAGAFHAASRVEVRGDPRVLVRVLVQDIRVPVDVFEDPYGETPVDAHRWRFAPRVASRFAVVDPVDVEKLAERRARVAMQVHLVADGQRAQRPVRRPRERRKIAYRTVTVPLPVGALVERVMVTRAASANAAPGTERGGWTEITSGARVRIPAGASTSVRVHVRVDAPGTVVELLADDTVVGRLRPVTAAQTLRAVLAGGDRFLSVRVVGEGSIAHAYVDAASAASPAPATSVSSTDSTERRVRRDYLRLEAGVPWALNVPASRVGYRAFVEILCPPGTSQFAIAYRTQTSRAGFRTAPHGLLTGTGWPLSRFVLLDHPGVSVRAAKGRIAIGPTGEGQLILENRGAGVVFVRVVLVGSDVRPAGQRTTTSVVRTERGAP